MRPSYTIFCNVEICVPSGRERRSLEVGSIKSQQLIAKLHTRSPKSCGPVRTNSAIETKLLANWTEPALDLHLHVRNWISSTSSISIQSHILLTEGYHVKCLLYASELVWKMVDSIWREESITGYKARKVGILSIHGMQSCSHANEDHVQVNRNNKTNFVKVDLQCATSR